MCWNQFLGVAEPYEFRRTKFARRHHLMPSQCFDDWSPLCTPSAAKLADFVIIATQDRHHKDPAVGFAQKGYHIMLEKPMATTEGRLCCV